MSWDAARRVLDTQFLTLPGLTPLTQVAWTGVPFDPPTGIWYKPVLLPSTNQPELQGANHETGIYQVSIFVPINTGPGALLQAADALVALFARKVLTGAATVSCGVPTPGPVIHDPQWTHLPVSIPFVCL
jgi:hypothetical protein